MRRTALIPAALGLALVAGCQSTATKGKNATVAPPTTPAAVAATTSAAPAATSSGPAPAATSTAPAPSSAAPPGPAQFGTTNGFIYTDGLAVSVLSAKQFTPTSPLDPLPVGDVAVLLSIRIKNGTAASFDPSLSSVNVHAGANGDQGGEIYQTGPPDLGGGFNGAIPVGQAATVSFGFAIPKGDLPNITVVVTPDFKHDDSTLTGIVS